MLYREPRGFGFVQYYDPDDAADAKYYMDGQVVLGRQITVVFAEENRKKPQEMRARDRVRFVGSSHCDYLAIEWYTASLLTFLLHTAGVVLMIGGILALGPLVITGGALLHAAEATRGMRAPCILILQFCLHSEHLFLNDAVKIFCIGRSPSPQDPKHRLRERSYSGSPVDSRSRSGSPYDDGYRRSSRRERSLSVSG